ncbi:GNAT family N-acetyltransferase [Veronia pacifica]|uniref:N-acetyltransferase domain-containing protein n=1 Tax=Veronia pacifica TaxID=1080227 RepID=A0A1C3EDJ8_9GAMM|nr:GNAT family protein [Veronia pacifica]ODA31305.1 hypothetical protein A8L45_17605 [Veronia pacifica]
MQHVRVLAEDTVYQIRQLVETDSASLYRHYKSCQSSATFVSSPYHQHESETLMAIQRWQQSYQVSSPNVLTYGIAFADSDEVVGLLVLVFTDKHAEIHIGLSVAQSGKGLATNVCLDGLKYLKRCGFDEVRTAPHCEHYASIRVLEKCGFENRGLLKNYASFPRLGKGMFDCADMRISLSKQSFL